MKGEIINCSAHKDIYFLETNTNSESTNLANLFASPAGREMFKYKPRTKVKQKLNPALEVFIQNKSTNSALGETTNNNKSNRGGDNKCSTSSSSSTAESCRSSRRNSLDLYEEAASILGLTCSQTDNCKCIECQCHYFDFEEDMDFSTGDCVVDNSSSCTIQ